MDSITSKEPSTSGAPSPVVNEAMCTMCSTQFASIQLLKRHKQSTHKIVSVSKESRIICPLCEGRYKLKTHQALRNHLKEKHAVNTELLNLQFSTIQEYESWKNKEIIQSGYAMHRTKRCTNYKEVTYICNRSDYKGYQANYQRRKEKVGGTIRIQGMCPSKFTCKLYDNGTVSMAFWRTHVGHERELRSLHLSKAEQDIVMNKIKSGVPINRILEDARNLKGPELQRINLINRDDITYLLRKHNVRKKKDPNEMVATALKVPDWNANGKISTIYYKEEVKEPEYNSVIKSENEEEIILFIEEMDTEEISEELEVQNEREVKWTNFKNWAEALNDEIFNRFMNNIQGAIRKVDLARQRPSNKRKIKI